MNLRQLKTLFEGELEAFTSSEKRLFFQRICDSYFGLKPHELVLNYDKKVSSYDCDYFDNVLKRLKKHEPIQYVLEVAYFFGLEFFVNSDVLIPRPETEELLVWVLKSIDRNKALKILDIGTGSACIAVALAKQCPNAKIYAMDVSADALKVAKTNAKNNKVNINFIEADIFRTEDLTSSFDVIVSNPPYVRQCEATEMASNVLDFEPALALFVNDNHPLMFYNAILKILLKNLSSGGFCFLEINEAFGSEIQALFDLKNFQNQQLKKDTFGKDRMFKIEKK